MPDTVRFDHYEVLTRDDGSLYELGRGAMGVTYKAFDTNLRMHVCLKVIAATHLHSEIARQRFIREARSAARLRNPNVAAVYHLGLQGETWFYAMEFIDGETIDGMIKRSGPLAPKLALEIVDQVARAFAAAEPHGLVHRDIKPANLMVIRDGDQVTVKVIDFGLAKSSQPDEESATLSHGGFVGTPHFASPEQLEERDLDVRSDIYSLGVTLWFMLAGRTPFVGSMAQVMSAHLSKTPPFEKLRVPAPLAKLLRRMLEKHALDRPQTAGDLRREVADCLVQLGDPASWVREAGEPQAPDDQAEYLTVADPRITSVELARFEVGELIAGRYRLIQALGDSNLGRVYRAQDQTRAIDVRLIVLHGELAVKTEALMALERMMDRLIGHPHPNVLRIDAVETIAGASFLVLEWSDGVSLLELLRARRELTALEVVALLGPVAAGLDHIVSCGVDEAELALHRVLVSFARPVESDWLRADVASWPDHVLKINPFSRRGAQAAGETWAAAQTVIEAPRTVGGAAKARAIRSLAALAYELLGGKNSNAAAALGSIDFKPLAALGEAGNEVLRRALGSEPPFDSASAFVCGLSQPDAVQFSRRDYLAGVSPTRTASTRALVEPVAHPSAPSAPSTKQGAVPWLVGIAALVLVAAGVWWATHPTPSQTITLVPTPEPQAEPSIPVVSTPVPTVGPTRRELLDQAVAKAKDLEARENWGEAVAAWVQVAKEFPESAAGKANLEAICGTLRARPDGLGPAVFVQLHQPLAEAADLGILSAMMVLGENLRRTQPEESLKWFKRAGEAGDLEGLTQAALMTADGRGTAPDFTTAVEMFQRAADKGHASAQTALAECYLYGKGVPKDEPMGIEWLEKAVAASDRRAFDLLATCYDKGRGVRRDSTKAAELYQKAIEAGYLPALGNLGVLYIRGEGVKADVKRAFALIQQGASAGEPSCLFLLGQCYETGTGTAPNPEKAKELHLQAAAKGDVRARRWCESKGISWTGGPAAR